MNLKNDLKIDLIALRARKYRSHWTSMISLNIPKCDPASPLFKLNRSYLLDSLSKKSDVVLYRRPAFVGLFTFLHERVINNSVLGYVVGSPGSGKSITALAFAATLQQHWVVTWIHVSKFHYPMCMRLENGQKKTRSFGTVNELLTILYTVGAGRRHIVFVDGFVDNNQHHVDIHMECLNWQKRDRETRRLVVVCSRFKAKLHEDKMDKIEEFFMNSWTKEEYFLAIQEHDFYESVKKNLDAVPEVVSESHSLNAALFSLNISHFDRSLKDMNQLI
jgi:hypothetical protein